MVICKKGLFLYDPGMGKTYSIAMGLKALKSVEPSLKCLFFIRKAQITQTSNDIRLYTGMKVVTCTGEKDQIFYKLSKDIYSYDILMLTHEALRSDTVCAFIYNYIKYFKVGVIDEIHYLTNEKESDRVLFLEALTSRLERVAGLTATPFISKAEQFASVLHIIDLLVFYRKDKIVKELKSGRRLDLQYPLQIYNYDRKSEGIENTYNVHVHWVEPHEFQLNLDNIHLLRLLRGPGSINQLRDLLIVVLKEKKRKKKGILFIYYHETREWVLPYLDKVGIVYGCINGETPQSDRDLVQQKFQDGLLDVVIISVTTSINLDSDYIYFYQYTLEIKQILGRGDRGLVPKIMDLYFLFTRRTEEAEYFLNTVYKLYL